MFTLLDRQRLPLAGLPAYVERVGIYRDFNARFFRLPPAKLATLLVDALEDAGAAQREDGWPGSGLSAAADSDRVRRRAGRATPGTPRSGS